MRAVLGAVLIAAATAVPSAAGPTCTLPVSDRAAVWRAANDATDSLGCHDGALRGGTTYVAGELGSLDPAFGFNGAGADVLVAHDANLWSLDTLSFRIDVRVFLEAGALSRMCVLVGVDEGGGPQNKWFFYLDAGGLGFHINWRGAPTGIFFGAPYSFIANTWYDVAVQRVLGIYTFFVNGLPVGAVSESAPIPDPNAWLTIGSAEGLGYFPGRIDEVRILRGVL
jgi:hypothetical protein